MGLFKIPFFLFLSIFSLHASFTALFINFIPCLFFELIFRATIPLFLKYSIHLLFCSSSAKSDLFKSTKRALFCPRLSMSGFLLLIGILASNSSIIRSISLISSFIWRTALVMCPGYH